MSTVVTAGAGKAMRKDAAFEVFAKGSAHKGLWCVVVTLDCTGERVPGLEVFGNGLVEKGALRVAWGGGVLRISLLPAANPITPG